AGIQDNWGVLDALYVYGEDSSMELGYFLEEYLVEDGAYHDSDRNWLSWEPGTRFEYTNVGASLAAYAVEEVRGESFDDVCDADIFGVLGMTDTGWHLADFDPDEVAVPYLPASGGWMPMEHYGFPDYPDGLLRSSAADMARFVAAIAGGGSLDGERILASETVDEMLTDQVPEVEVGQGVLWATYEMADRTLVGHDGGDLGVTTEIGLDPATGNGFVLLMNLDWDLAGGQAFMAIETALMDAAEAR
ncbi:MAG: serine hydrolase domain-containing protein, partial [Myxococcota bacterium]|nr:serine hydrolase domain-containing protein [Myxococcota bacterium]